MNASEWMHYASGVAFGANLVGLFYLIPEWLHERNVRAWERAQPRTKWPREECPRS